MKTLKLMMLMAVTVCIGSSFRNYTGAGGNPNSFTEAETSKQPGIIIWRAVGFTVSAANRTDRITSIAVTNTQIRVEHKAGAVLPGLIIFTHADSWKSLPDGIITGKIEMRLSNGTHLPVNRATARKNANSIMLEIHTTDPAGTAVTINAILEETKGTRNAG